VDPVRLHRPLKRLGQNFLKDPDIVSRIVSLARLDKNDTVLEPGAGYGAITEQLQTAAARIVAVEKDRWLAAFLRSRFRNTPSVQVVEGDVLKVHLPPFNKVVGTPPYNVSSRLILFLLSSKFEAAHLVFQKEFGERLLARPGTADYGRLSVTVQRKLVVSALLHIRRGSFDPVPKVDSLLLSLTPKPEQIGEGHDEVFDELVRAVFSQRRRVVKGVLLRYLESRLGRSRAKTALEGLTLPDARVFQLSAEQLEDLAVQLGPWLKPERLGEKRF
jgi:16S rRNA (adenine1518-N6/adenine1519-N6)-dimethyltransferase